jgi:hypothetical protein
MLVSLGRQDASLSRVNDPGFGRFSRPARSQDALPWPHDVCG